MEKPTWTTLLPVILSFFSGGFAGAVFTWYINRPVPTVVTYAVTTTTTGTDKVVKSLIPNIKIQIGDKEIPLFTTHVIEVQMQSGQRIDKADVAILFPPEVHFFGVTAEAPSPLHHIDCSLITEGVSCTIYPLTLVNLNKYRINIATDEGKPTDVVTTADKVEFIPLEEFVRNNKPFLERSSYLLVGIWTLLLIVQFLFLMMIARQSKRLDGEIARQSKRLDGEIARLQQTEGEIARLQQMEGKIVELTKQVISESEQLRGKLKGENESA